MKNKGNLQENTRVKLCFADTSGSCVYSYEAIFRNGWFDHGEKNSRHDTLSDVDGCYVWYEVIGEATEMVSQIP